MKKLLALLIIPILILSGCGVKSTSPATSATEPLTSVTLMLDWTPNTNHTGLFVAQEKGYFSKEGLDVEFIQPSSSGNVEQLVAAGKSDFGVSHQEQVTTARANDVPILSLAAILQHNTSGFASPTSKNIKNAKDFEGKTYGGWGLPSEDAILKALMENEKADFSKIKMVNIGEADQLISLTKDIDLTWIFYGWTGKEAELRKQTLDMLWLKDVDPALDFYTPVLITSEKMTQSQPAVIRHFIQAVSDGYQYAIQNPQEAAEILIKHAPEANPDLIRSSQTWLSPQYQADAPQWGIQKSAVWEGYAKWLVERDLLQKMIDPAKAFTNDFLPKS
ncbi:ABC transporter substrate-binding protein [Desulfosporosinus sp. BICA1-9]|uniref:ABC transporter substrate-binding protein n=1 Tax=Desulfosporosinus sp. BICA1-9 TaxID=1531958 RepID=UPI00054BED90|nr:ABC transporter substrate-binding protein [Desulfosporosinus sp. BICA1-9]KJS50422.1 MAG: ABC transporter substrate-binding protein [Peptococcaceae bacterium BRH_c23]KJS82256.1 MAG: ABC transporter substrate-binding protein [Desulfosporosinus sp. BICA1-9]KJS88996.1 MAG: ABC transporter substrate-binding protein [Desulfosporosinus sp. BICA1-9]HBW37988.1 ABC transporter substrate-binding protein [Desulfosporosinus sp.]